MRLLSFFMEFWVSDRDTTARDIHRFAPRGLDLRTTESTGLDCEKKRWNLWQIYVDYFPDSLDVVTLELPMASIFPSIVL